MLASGEKVLVHQKIGREYHLFLLLNFPRTTILNFYDIIWLPNAYIRELPPNNSGNHTHMIL